MNKYKLLKKDLGNICRVCLNKKYGLNLQPKHCIYDIYPGLCGECNNVKNIVRDIHFSKRIFM